MRHLTAHRRLNRTTEHLQALLGNLVTALIQHEQIRTTLPKAKEARRVAEKLITMAKDNALHYRRLAGRTVRDADALRKLFDTLGPRFKSRPGGYTRVVKIGRRVGDAAPMAVLELVERSPKEEAVEPAAEAKSKPEGAEPKAKKTPKAAKAAGTTAPKAGKGPKGEGSVKKSSAKGSGGTGAKKGSQRGV
jgi:large subunit ribosomal protein L17